MFIVCIGLAAGVDNPQGNNPICEPCSSYGIGFNGPLEYTPYPEPLNDGAQNPGDIYVVYSVIDKESKPWWTQAAGVWQVWGPYEFKAGRNHILKFGPGDIVGITEGPLPYYVEGTAAWLQVENVDYVDEKAYAYCIVPKAMITAVESEKSRTPGQSSPQSSIRPVDYAMASEVDEESSDVITRTNSFSSTDARVYCWLKFENIKEGHEIEWRWYSPDGNLFHIENREIPSPEDMYAWYNIYSFLYIEGHHPENMPGNWQVDAFIDGEFIVTQQFTIGGIATIGWL